MALNANSLRRNLVPAQSLGLNIQPERERVPLDPIGGVARGVAITNAMTRGEIDRNNLEISRQEREQQNELNEALRAARTNKEIVDAVRIVNPLKAIELENDFAAADAKRRKEMVDGLDDITNRFRDTPPEQHEQLYQFYAQSIPGFAEEFPGGINDPTLQALLSRNVAADPTKVTNKQVIDENGNVFKYTLDEQGRVVPGSVQNLTEDFGIKGKAAGTTVNVGTGTSFKVPTGFMLANPEDPSQGVVAIPGGSKDRQTPEAAAKTQLLESGLVAFDEAAFFIFEGGDIDNGDVQELNIINMQDFSVAGIGPKGVPLTEGRQARQLILDAVEAKLRAESGAAVPDTEVQRAAQRFFPSPFDSDEAVRSKMRRMRAFLVGTKERILKGQPKEEPEAPPPTERVVIDGVEYMIINGIPYQVVQ